MGAAGNMRSINLMMTAKKHFGLCLGRLNLLNFFKNIT
jgi:hypothetical protein